MKTVLPLVLFVALLTSCAHQQVHDVEFKGTLRGIQIHIDEIAQFTEADLQSLEKAMASSSSRKLKLSGEIPASCQNQKCRIEVRKNVFGEMVPSDLAKFTATLKKAQGTGKEEILKSGALRIRCQPDRCVADIRFEQEEVPLHGHAKVSTEADQSGVLLGAFIGGMIQGMLGY